MYAYIGWRLIVPAAFGLPVSLLLWGLLVVLLILPFMPIFLRMRGVEGGFIDVVAWIGYLGFGFLTLLFALVLLKDLSFLLFAVGKKVVSLVASNPGDSVDPFRRQLLTNYVNLGVLGISSALTGYGIFQALRLPKVVDVTVPIKNLPDDLNGFRIVQISDIHVSHTIKRPFVEKVVDTVNELNPDLIALTGDLVDGSVEQLRDDVAPLANLRAPDGLYFITGNHEYYSGVQQWVDETKRLGFTVLLNEHRVITRGESSMLLAGVTDPAGNNYSKEHVSDPHRAIKGAPTCDARILLAHQPRSIYEASRAGFDFVLSGHTHGGQYFPYHFLAALAQPYIAGLHEHGATQIYVSRGTGYWGPQLRIGAPSEITVHTLVTA
jgi:predicted MPP superfamily phosphohydrolase